jgi:predicted nucleic acid-binding protein
MTRVLLDTNVILDVILDRQPQASRSVVVWSIIETGKAQGLLAAHALTTIHYLIRRETGSARAKRTISAVLTVLGIAAVDARVIQLAMQLPSTDFEDAVTAAAAQLAGCDYVVTRDPKGFKGSGIKYLLPEEAIPLLRVN